MAKKKVSKRDTIAKAMAKAGGTTLSPAKIYKAEEIVPSAILPTGYAGVDRIIGIGGIPSGQITTLAGPPACGKTTLALDIVIAAQRLGGIGVYLDFENKFEMAYALRLGVDPNYFILANPNYIEEGFKKVEDMLKVLRAESDTMPVVFVWDSVSSSKAKATFEAGWEDNNWAKEARVFSDKLPRFTKMLSVNNAFMIGIAQKRTATDGGIARDKIGPGWAWMHYTPLCIKWKGPKREKGKIAVGTDGAEVSTLEVSKNQIGPPWRTCSLRMEYGSGYSRVHSLLEEAVLQGLVTKKGSRFYLKDGSETCIGNGHPAATKYLLKNEEIIMELHAQLSAPYTAPIVGTPTADGLPFDLVDRTSAFAEPDPEDEEEWDDEDDEEYDDDEYDDDEEE